MNAVYLVVEDGLQILLAGGAEHPHDVVELVQVMLTRKDRAVGEHLSKDAAHGPHVDRLVVTLQENVRSISNTIYLLFQHTLEFTMISGALYHLVATYSVRKPV